MPTRPADAHPTSFTRRAPHSVVPHRARLAVSREAGPSVPGLAAVPRRRVASAARFSAAPGRLGALLLMALLVGACATATPPASVLPAGSGAVGTGDPGAGPGGGNGGGGGGAGSGTPAPTLTPTPTPMPTPTPLPEVPATELQVRLDASRTSLRLPGVSVAIRWLDGRTWTGTAGWADVAAKVPVTTETAFSVASMSKTFTAAVVLQLVEEGRLALDEPVASLIPEFKLDRRVTLAMLLDHTSGLPDYFLNPKIDAALRAKPDAAWTPAQALAFVPTGRGTPGTGWRYANTNYLLLGLLIEHVTGNPVSEEVRTRLLDPLGLDATWYQVDEAPIGPLARGYRLVRTESGGRAARAVAPMTDILPFRSVVTAAGAAGSIGSTAMDVARWMEALVTGDVLDPAMRDEMAAHAEVTRALKARVPYGLGVQVVTLRDHIAIGHSGRFAGYRGLVRHLPTAGLTIAVLTNQNQVDPALVASDLLSILLPPGSCDICPTPSPGTSPGASPSEEPGLPTPTADASPDVGG